MAPAFILLLGMAALSSAAMLQGDFDRANRLYAQGQYAAARQIYLELAANCGNWKIHFNAGNACYKLGLFLDAKVQYLKARKLKPLAPTIERNIQIVNRHFRDKLPAPKIDFFSVLFLRLFGLLSDSLMLGLLLVFALATNLFLYLLIRGKRTRLALYGLLLGFLSFCAVSGYQNWHGAQLRAVTSAVLIRENADLRSGPGLNNTVLFKVNPGLELRILDHNGDWYQVSASSQIAGWIEAGALQLI